MVNGSSLLLVIVYATGLMTAETVVGCFCACNVTTRNNAKKLKIFDFVFMLFEILFVNNNLFFYEAKLTCNTPLVKGFPVNDEKGKLNN